MSERNGQASRSRNGLMSKNGLVAKNVQGLLQRRGVTTTSVMATMGSVLTDYVFQKRLEKWQAEHQFNLNSYALSKGIGRLLGCWLIQLAPQATDEEHQTFLSDNALGEASLKTLTHWEQAVLWFLASKVMIHVAGMGGENPPYVHFQKEAQQRIAADAEWPNVDRGELFLGKPFPGDVLFAKAHRLLQLMTPPEQGENLNDFLTIWRSRDNLVDDADYYAYLIALTHDEQDEARLITLIEGWYSQYSRFKIQQIQQQKKWVVSGLAMLTGGLTLDSLKGVFKR